MLEIHKKIVLVKTIDLLLFRFQLMSLNVWKRL